jgi:hypothetical protein
MILGFRDKYCIDQSIMQDKLFILGPTFFYVPVADNKLDKISSHNFYVYDISSWLCKCNDYKVYSINASSEIDKLFQNLTPDYLGSKDFSITGGVDLLKNISNLSNLLS